MPIMPDDATASETSSSLPIGSRRQRKLNERTAAAIGEPVLAANTLWVEGTMPYLVLGLAVGVGVLQGVLGALIGIGIGYLIARLLTRRRSVGFPFATVIAVTATHLYAMRVSFWSGRPQADHQLGKWPLAQVPMDVRRKRLTTAVALSLPDGRRVRLEKSGRWSPGEGPGSLIAYLRRAK